MKNGRRDGKGIANYLDSKQYVGEFKNGKFHGKGIFTFTKGEKYIGEFEEGKIDGTGKCFNIIGISMSCSKIKDMKDQLDFLL